ncbi:hypothetical protein [Halodesulfovibrio spirochaetisodalis]|uniref:Uncharacterized protein n=1 Tax=Halodesulfovibrio spirochaetisodalis TaxID=1560234 RepID=A0A1B7XAB5_9BACT|nr:hypothetical protein [Halodesulfovibrio spirochaetisodalis]OBQ46323.1 hypothetical protein SP90_12985 [Halodesulfovibrio spirochaetisodalis]
MPSSIQAMTTEEFMRKEVFKSHDSSGSDTRTRRNNLQTQYWKVIPNEGACEKCQAMGQGVHWEKPERPHPNCKCEMVEGSILVGRFGKIDGWRDTASEQFTAGQSINVFIRSLGPMAGGAHIWVDGSQHTQTGHMLPNSSRTYHFTKFGELPLTWQVDIMTDGVDNCTFTYNITN